jgi:hypothetical protein
MLCLSPLLLEHYFVLLRNLDVNYVFRPRDLPPYVILSLFRNKGKTLKKYHVILQYLINHVLNQINFSFGLCIILLYGLLIVLVL